MSAAPDPAELPPVSSLDEQVSRMLRRSERLTWVIVAVLVAMLAGGWYLFRLQQATDQRVNAQQSAATSQIDARVRKDTASICGFMKIIGTVQVPASATLILVQWVESARVAYYGHGCAPALPPPSPELRAEAARYHVELTR